MWRNKFSLKLYWLLQFNQKCSKWSSHHFEGAGIFTVAVEETRSSNFDSYRKSWYPPHRAFAQYAPHFFLAPFLTLDPSDFMSRWLRNSHIRWILEKAIFSTEIKRGKKASTDDSCRSNPLVAQRTKYDRHHRGLGKWSANSWDLCFWRHKRCHG